MEVRAVAKYVRVQPRKVRIIADEVRGKSAVHVAHLLRFHPSKSAKALRKVVISAIANAVENNQADADGLKISTIMVDEGPRMKRIQARAMGRANRILKKTSHITVVVDDSEAEVVVKPHGTKAKPRPTFATGKGKKRGGAAKPKAEEAAPVQAKAEEPVTPAETTDTDAEEITAAAEAAPQPEEATPVTESDAPEERGSATPAPEAETEAPASEEKGAQEN
jgi:large subunit ribosomal protein L22